MTDFVDQPDELALRAWPSRLIVETTTRCNLACVMCPRQNAGPGGSEEACEDGDLDEACFDALAPAFPHLASLVLNGIGEPLLHPGLDGFVVKARAAMPRSGTIGFQTNGLLMDTGRATSLIVAGLDKACVSVDAMDAALFGDIRVGGSRAAAGEALGALDMARKGLGARDFRIGIEFVVMRKNLEELPKVLRWAAGGGADFAIVSQLFPYAPDSMAMAAWDANLDVAIELKDKYAAEGLRRGLDIGRYPEVFMRYVKSPSDEDLVKLVADMQAEAIERGVTLNIERLLAPDAGIYGRSRAIFAEAAAIAAGEGLEIALPEVLPRSARECEFVEGGSAFVSRSGGVHPCYFLWHRYACHAGGWEKKVAPRSFGSLNERGILEIWNDPDFLAFRASVLRYEYPFCLNCNLALCDYVQMEEVEQDCHINHEPCAVCLWCMGLFRCMA